MPADVVFSRSEFYRVVPNRPVVLTIETGDGQVSGTSLRLDGQAHPFNNPDGPQEIGAGRNLVNSMLHIHTIVGDVNPATNRTSVTYRLTGGVESATHSFAVDVSGEKGAAHYVIVFFFIA
jgi:hypothetical protein